MKQFKFQYFPVYESRVEAMPVLNAFFKRKVFERVTMIACVTSFCSFNYYALLEFPVKAVVYSVIAMSLTG